MNLTFNNYGWVGELKSLEYQIRKIYNSLTTIESLLQFSYYINEEDFKRFSDDFKTYHE